MINYMIRKAYMHGCGNTFLVVNDLGDSITNEHIKNQSQINNIYTQLNGKMPVDGFLCVKRSNVADLKMIYFSVNRKNKNLIRRKMCGNGVRCFSRFAIDHVLPKDTNSLTVETDDGIKNVSCSGDMIEVSMESPEHFERISNDFYFMNVGVPHYVTFVDKIDRMVVERKREVLKDNDVGYISNDSGAVNLNVVKVDGKNEISIITREGGVAGITEACGTGSVASAYMSKMILGMGFPITVHNPGGDIIIDKNGSSVVMKGPADYIEV
jgi:diaminopimelate epimerase